MDVHYYEAGQSVTVAGELVNEPAVSNGQQMLGVKNYAVWVPIYPTYHFGDRVEVKGIVSCLAKAVRCREPRIYRASVELQGKGQANGWMATALAIRSELVEIYQSMLPSNQAGLFTGITLGSVGMDKTLRDKLAVVGLTHVVAASGMNVSIFSGFALWLLGRLQLRRSLICATTMLFVLLYCTVTGFEPPIVRAAIMFGLIILASTTGRQNNGWWGLGIAGYVMLWAEPRLVISASFLLSFTAMMGQVYLSNHHTSLPNSLAQSLYAIVFTFPIVLVFFAKFSLVSLFTNALVLWTVEPLMILGGIAGIVGTVSIQSARLVALAAGPLLAYFLGVVDIFSKNDSLLLRLPGLDWTFILGYYMVLLAVGLWWRWRKANVRGFTRLTTWR